MGVTAMAWTFDLATDIGGRKEQQDRAQVLTVTGRDDEYLLVLADGMGGRQQGAVAAQAVVDSAREAFGRMHGDDPRGFLTDLCLAAHQAILDIGARNATNPGSTCTVLYLKTDEAYWAHVGDSRLYHFHAGRLLTRTRDHTVAELLGEDTGTRPDNRLYMCLGGQNVVEPEIGASAVGENDWFLLCSDGLWNQIDSAEMAERLGDVASADAASSLVSLAATRGGTLSDNVSLVLARYDQAAPQTLLQRFMQPASWFGR